MSQFSTAQTQTAELSRLRAHTAAVRRNKDILGPLFNFLSEQPPNASAAQEAFEEIDHKDQIDLFLAPTKGGIWETWERDVLKTGDIPPSYEVYLRRIGAV